MRWWCLKFKLGLSANGMNVKVTLSSLELFCPWPVACHECFTLQETPNQTDLTAVTVSCSGWVRNPWVWIQSVSTPTRRRVEEATCFHQWCTSCLRLYSNWQEQCNFHLNPFPHGSLSAPCFSKTCKSGPIQEVSCPNPSIQRWSQYSTAIYSWLYDGRINITRVPWKSDSHHWLH